MQNSSNSRPVTLRKPIFLLTIVFALWLCALLPGTRNTTFFYDDYNHFKRVHKTQTTLAAWFEPDEKDSRRAPISVLALRSGYELFGLNPQGYFLLHYLFHFMNALLLMILACRLKANPSAAFFSGVFFLCSGAFYQILIAIPGWTRSLSLFFFLCASIHWLDYLKSAQKSRLILVCLWQTLAILSSAVAFVFPLLALGWACYFYRNNTAHLKKILLRSIPLVLACLLLILWVWTDFFSGHRSEKWLQGNSPIFLLSKVVSLFRMLFVPLMIPEKDLLGLPLIAEAWFRLLPLLTGILLFITCVRPSNWPRVPRLLLNATLIPALIWILTTSLLHFPFPLQFEHTTRYLYFPMAGFCLWLGSFWDGLHPLFLTRFKRAGLLIFAGLTAVILMLNTAATAHYARLYQAYGRSHPEEVFTEKIHLLYQEQP